MTGWAGANYAARLDLEENSLTRIKNVHIFNVSPLLFYRIGRLGVPVVQFFNSFSKVGGWYSFTTWYT